jgi:hypothetical protein
VGAATGTYVVGSSFMVGCTWQSAGPTVGYVDGLQYASTAGAVTTATTSGVNWCIGCWNNGGASGGSVWANEKGDGLYFLAFWDRVLSPIEVRSLSTDPSQIFISPRDQFLAMLKGVAALAAQRRMLMMGVQ